MFKSIRWTLQLWHAGILFLALSSFGTVLYLAAVRTTYTEVDNELAAAARVLASTGTHDSKTVHTPNNLQLALASSPADNDSSRIVSDAVPPAIELIHSATSPQTAPPTIPAWLKNVPQDCLCRLGWSDSDQPYFIVEASDGSIVRHSSECPFVPATPITFVSNSSNKPDSTTPEFRQRGDYREVSMAGPAGSTILVGRSIQREIATLATLRLNLMGAGAVVLAVGLLGGSILSRRVLHPIRLISDTARSISASDLSRRIDGQETKSELGSLVHTLNKTFDRLESAFNRQAQFTADASHELRTPLAVIHASSELALKRERASEEYRQTIESNLRASRRMQSLVESLLVLARADANALELSYAPIDLRKVADDCVTLLWPVATKRNIQLAVQGSGLQIEADQNRILQLATNLISNAIQYNRDGGSVTITIARDDQHAILKIADTGIGIAPEDQPHIFERFFRVETARTRESGGCGLGLAICQSIARAHNGSISFTSKPNAGTTFTVRLPLSRNEG